MKNPKKQSRVTFDDVEPGEIIYMYGDPYKCFVVDTKLQVSILLHEKGHDPIVGRIGLVKSEFEGRWFREPRSYMKFAAQEDDPIPKLSPEQFSTVVLKRIKQVCKMAFGEHVIENMDMRSIRDHMTGDIIFSLRTSVMAESLSDRKKTVTFQYPSSWWQFFKFQNFSPWLLRKFPVKFTKTDQLVHFEEVALYPMLPAMMPEQSGEVYFQSMWHQDYSEKNSQDEHITVTVS